MVERHGPNRYSKYRSIWESCRDELYRRAFVQADNLEWKPISRGFRLRGQFSCLGQILVEVDKRLADLDGEPDPLVRTVRYSYCAYVAGRGEILRHDDAHAHAGHPDPHHRHMYDWRTGRELRGSPRHVGVDGWPHLTGFVDDVANIYWDHVDDFPEGVEILPDVFVPRYAED